MLTDNEVEHIAKLARIELTDDMRGRFKKELSSILDYIESLNGADTSGVGPLYQVTGAQNSVRADEYRGDWPMDSVLSDLLVGQAPHKEDHYVKVKTVKGS